jgi:hypothetical protein
LFAAAREHWIWESAPIYSAQFKNEILQTFSCNVKLLRTKIRMAGGRNGMRKKYNVTGVCIPEKHYMVDISQKLESAARF